MSVPELSALTLISESLKRIGEGATSIAEIVLDLTAEQLIQPPMKTQQSIEKGTLGRPV